jgi:hypothetical protein
MPDLLDHKKSDSAGEAKSGAAADKKAEKK